MWWMFSTNVLFFWFQTNNPHLWDYFIDFYTIYMLVLFPGFPPHFAKGYKQDYKVNCLWWSSCGVGRRDYNCIAMRTRDYDEQLQFFSSVSPRAILQPAQNTRGQTRGGSLLQYHSGNSLLFPGAIPVAAVGQWGTDNKMPFALCLPRWELMPSCGSRGFFPQRTGVARHWWTSRCAGSSSSRCLGFSSQWATRSRGASTASSLWYIAFWWLLVHGGGIGVIFWAHDGELRLCGSRWCWHTSGAPDAYWSSPDFTSRHLRFPSWKHKAINLALRHSFTLSS